jgi:uncharacterized membrane protein
VNARLRGWARGLGVAAVALGYAILAHISNSNPQAHVLGVVLALTPLLFALLVFLWRSGHRAVAVVVAVLAGLAIARWWPVLAAHFPWLYLVQQAGVYAFLGLMFGRSLIGGREALCTHWATQVHGALSPAMTRYTRQVTMAWTVFFAAMTSALVVVFLLAPLHIWSAFANFCGLPLVVAMFIGEYLVRGQVLPGIDHASILDGVRAFLGSSAPDAVRRS